MSLALHELSTAGLRALAGSLRSGPLSLGVSRQSLEQIAGPLTGQVEACLVSLLTSGMTPAQVSIVADSIADAREQASDPTHILDLIISGPDVPGVPTGDTAATMRTLITDAQHEILLVGYAVHNARSIFEPLATKMAANQNLKVAFCLDIPRKLNDTSLDSEIVRRFCRDFTTKHWPWPNLPRIYYDPRSLSTSKSTRSSLHAKCVVADRNAALITSANFTDAAQRRNIEVGVLVHHPALVERIADYFAGLASTGHLALCPTSETTRVA